MNLLIHAVLNFTIRSQALANIHEIFQNIFILRNGVGSSFSTPCTCLAFQMALGNVLYHQQKSDGTFRIPRGLEDDLRSFECFRKITLTTSLPTARRGRDWRTSQEQKRQFKERETTTIFSSGNQSCAWPCSGPFCWQNPWFGCNSGISLVVFLEYTLFQLCSNFEQIS